MASASVALSRALQLGANLNARPLSTVDNRWSKSVLPKPSASRPSTQVGMARASDSKRKFTGFVEKDTAGQQNIYAVEPDIYVTDSVISTNSQGTSEDGSGGTLIISGFLAVAAISGAAIILTTVGQSTLTPAQETYIGPPLSYYIQKFQDSTTTEQISEASIAAPDLTQPEEVISEPVISEPAAIVAEPVIIPETPSVETSESAVIIAEPEIILETPSVETSEPVVIIAEPEIIPETPSVETSESAGITAEAEIVSETPAPVEAGQPDIAAAGSEITSEEPTTVVAASEPLEATAESLPDN